MIEPGWADETVLLEEGHDLVPGSRVDQAPLGEEDDSIKQLENIGARLMVRVSLYSREMTVRVEPGRAGLD